MKSFAIAKSIQRTISSSFQVVSRPDHPLLLSGPDLLIGGEGKITAVFLIQKAVRQPQLRARITASRLALPAETRILALVDDNSGPMPNSLLSNFDEIFVGKNDARAISVFASTDTRSKVNKQDLLNSKRRHSILFATALQIAILRHKHSMAIQPSLLILKELEARTNRQTQDVDRKWQRRKEVEVNGSNVSSLRGGSTMVSDLRSAWQSGLNAKYTLDTGVPYADMNSQPSILLAEEWPTMKIDPEKPIRASAFSGWIIAQPTNSDEIEQLIERVQTVTRKRIYERS